jgi:hypothetical protein
MAWDVVDEASLESFPASDPPGWGSYRIDASADTIGLPNRRVRPQRARGALPLGMIMSVLAIGVIWVVRRYHREPTRTTCR